MSLIYNFLIDFICARVICIAMLFDLKFWQDKDLFEKWKNAVPPRTFRRIPNPRQCPTGKDHLCSLHFKEEDVIKFYEISNIKGCPKSEVVKIERGTWTLKPNAVPCYFYDNNPDAKQMLHERRIVMSTKLSKREVPTRLDEISDNCEENIDSESTSVKIKSDALGLIDQTCGDLKNNSNAVYNDLSNKCEKNCDLYTIEQLHQDVLEIALQKTWTFIQDDDDFSTQFISYDKEMFVKCVEFLGSCVPLVTIRNSAFQYNRVNSKQDIEKLLETVSVL